MSGLFLGQPVARDAEGKVSWAINALKKAELWTRQLAAITVNYDDTSTSLGVRNVQGAIEALDTSVDALLAELYPPGHLFGLTLSNNAGDATNDIDFAAGTARDSTSTADMVATAMTKQLDVSWAAGTAAGGRMSAAAIANTTYHCFVIKNPTSGLVDFGFDTSATAPTLPTGYTKFRRIGSIVRTGGAIKAFKQDGDRFRWTAASVQDVAATAPGTSAVTRTLTVPLGIVVQADIAVDIANVTSAQIFGLLTALDETDRAASTTDANCGAGNGTGRHFQAVMLVKTDTSAQIRSRLSASGASDVLNIYTFGWIDTRGRLA